MDEDDLPTELELAAMMKVLMSLPKEEAEKLIEAYCVEDDNKPDRSHTTAPYFWRGEFQK